MMVENDLICVLIGRKVLYFDFIKLEGYFEVEDTYGSVTARQFQQSSEQYLSVRNRSA